MLPLPLSRPPLLTLDPAGAVERAGHGQDAAGDRRQAAVGVVGGQGQDARAGLGQGAGPADRAGVGERVGVVEDQQAAVADRRAGQGFAAAAVADLERAAVDRCRAGDRVRAGERQAAADRQAQLVGRSVGEHAVDSLAPATVRMESFEPLLVTVPIGRPAAGRTAAAEAGHGLVEAREVEDSGRPARWMFVRHRRGRRPSGAGRRCRSGRRWPRARYAPLCFRPAPRTRSCGLPAVVCVE